MLEINVGQRHSVTVHAQGQYQLISNVDDPGVWPAPDGLTTGAEGWLSVLTGTRYGPINLDIEFLEGAPTGVRGDFEMIAERDINVDNEILEIQELHRSAFAE